jgi:hypothetical protein
LVEQAADHVEVVRSWSMSMRRSHEVTPISGTHKSALTGNTSGRLHLMRQAGERTRSSEPVTEVLARTPSDPARGMVRNEMLFLSSEIALSHGGDGSTAHVVSTRMRSKLRSKRRSPGA